VRARSRRGAARPAACAACPPSATESARARQQDTWAPMRGRHGPRRPRGPPRRLQGDHARGAAAAAPRAPRPPARRSAGGRGAHPTCSSTKCSAHGFSRTSRLGRPRLAPPKLTTSRSRQKCGSCDTSASMTRSASSPYLGACPASAPAQARQPGHKQRSTRAPQAAHTRSHPSCYTRQRRKHQKH